MSLLTPVLSLSLILYAITAISSGCVCVQYMDERRKSTTTTTTNVYIHSQQNGKQKRKRWKKLVFIIASRRTELVANAWCISVQRHLLVNRRREQSSFFQEIHFGFCSSLTFISVSFCKRTHNQQGVIDPNCGCMWLFGCCEFWMCWIFCFRKQFCLHQHDTSD